MGSTSDKIRVLLVDDHSMLRQTLRSTLAPYPNIEVVGEATDGEDALAHVEHLRPAVVVMDIHMPRMDGITATRLIKERYPVIGVIGLSVEQQGYLLSAMHQAGAREVVSKLNVITELPGAIERAGNRPA